jgi:N-glycosylase/DNA lyase
MRFTLQTPFDLKATFESGQPVGFLWNKIRSDPDFWWYPHERGIVQIHEGYHGISVSGLGEVKSLGKFVTDTFRLTDNLTLMYMEIGNEEPMKSIMNEYVGLRVCKVGLWEALACMIISQNNNLTRIRNNVQDLKKFGEQVGVGSIKTNFFPKPEELTKNKIKSCNLGYRCDYLWDTAKIIADGGLKGIEKKSTEQAREVLMKLPGVGRKVADTVLLFGLGKLDVFPTDVWIERVMKKLYNVNNKEVQEFAQKKWGRWQGYAQQYLYYWSLNNMKRGEKMGKKKKKRK